ncbi:putative toxin-antitoxin system toxin component, PIN family [Fibrella sp. WM1]|uniref:putative toxin-antitoxin system toxin component, PIN family n=1 Tax=Fibrella musci TaxID=3242485 RepID=UPI00352175F0
MRIVLDTNCLLAIIPRVSPYRAVFDAYRSGQFELAVSTEILEEYAEILERKMTVAIANNVLELIDRQYNTVQTEIYYRWSAIASDYDDNKFVDCAVSPGVDYLVTNDSHFSALQQLEFPAVRCLTLQAFMALL